MPSMMEEELGKELASYNEALQPVIEEWKVNRKLTVKLLRSLADEIQTHEENCRVATLAGSSTSIVGTGLTIGGLVAAFFTFGSALIVSAVGAGVAMLGGSTVFGTGLVNSLLKSSNVKAVNDALKVDKEASDKVQRQVAKIQEVISRIEVLSREKIIGKGCATAISFANTVKTAAKTGIQFGKGFDEAGLTLFQNLGRFSKAFHALGLAFGAINLVLDIHCLISTSVKVHKGSVLEVVKDIRKLAQSLEDEFNVIVDNLKVLSQARVEDNH